jgi:hypothetical protein
LDNGPAFPENGAMTFPRRGGVIASLALAWCAWAPAQDVPLIGYHVPLDVGWSTVVNGTSQPQASRPIVVSQPSSPWIKVWFGAVDLGAASVIRVTGVADGAVQVLDAGALAAWSGTSAYFNGNQVIVELVVAPFDAASAWMAGYDTGFPVEPGIDSICGVDDRVPSHERRVGRLLNSSLNAICTAALVSADACILTAGHCFGAGSVFTVEFNCPPSLPSGAIVHPGPEHQYPVDLATLQRLDAGVGNDWALARLEHNTTHGLSAALLQDFFTLDLPPAPGAAVRVPGFGSASGVDNYAHREHTGPLTLVGGATGTELQHQVDTSGGNSGSPMIEESTGRVFGIHTHGGCAGSFGINSGTSVLHRGFGQAYLTGCAPPHAFAITQDDPASAIHLAVAGAPPLAEIVNVYSITRANPTGSGPMFGLAFAADVSEILDPFFMPVGSHPFHVLADATGAYALSFPPAGLPFPVSLDAVSLAFAPGSGFTAYLSRSAVIAVTLWL